MRTLIKKLLNNIDMPKIEENYVEINSILDTSFLDNVNTKTEFNFNKEEIKTLLEDKDNFLSEENYNKLKNVFENNTLYDEDISEENVLAYINTNGKFYINPLYLYNQLKNNEDIKIYVYDVSEYLARAKYGLEYHNVFESKFIWERIKSPSIDIELKNEIKKVNIFEDKFYKSNLKIDDIKVNVLCTNLSYLAYKNQILHENIISYNEVDGFRFGNLSKEEFIEKYDDIRLNAIKQPLIFNIDNGFLTSLSINDNIILLIAKILKIPKIPAILYTSNNIELRDAILDDLKINKHYEIEMSFKNLSYDIEPYFILSNQSEIKDYWIHTFTERYYLGLYNYIKPNMDYHWEYDLYALDQDSKNEIPDESKIPFMQLLTEDQKEFVNSITDKIIEEKD